MKVENYNKTTPCQINNLKIQEMSVQKGFTTRTHSSRMRTDRAVLRMSSD